MQKRKQKTIGIKEFDDLVSQHGLKEVAPPDEARKDLIQGGKSAMSVQEATKTWFKTAKSQSPSSGFLAAPETLDAANTNNQESRQMLYKGKKKSKE